MNSYIPGEQFELLIQLPLEAKRNEELEKLSSDQLLKLQRELLGVPDSEIIKKGRRKSITRKTREQVGVVIEYLNVCKLSRCLVDSSSITTASLFS